MIEVSDRAPLGRDALHAVLAAENVTARRYFRPGCHRSPPYDAEELRQPLPVTEHLSTSLLQLPTGLQLTPDDASRIAGVVRTACAHAGQVTPSLARQGAA